MQQSISIVGTLVDKPAYAFSKKTHAPWVKFQVQVSDNSHNKLMAHVFTVLAWYKDADMASKWEAGQIVSVKGRVEIADGVNGVPFMQIMSDTISAIDAPFQSKVAYENKLNASINDLVTNKPVPGPSPTPLAHPKYPSPGVAKSSTWKPMNTLPPIDAGPEGLYPPSGVNSENAPVQDESEVPF